MRRLFPTLLAVCVLSALAAGCGSGGGSTESSGGTVEGNIQKILPRPSHVLNKAELIQFSHKVCANITRELDGGFERYASEHGLEAGKQPTQAELREIGEELQLPLMHKQDREMINAGKAPSAESAQKIFEIGEDEVRKGWKHPAVAGSDPGQIWTRTNPMLRSYGFVTCVRDQPLFE